MTTNPKEQNAMKTTIHLPAVNGGPFNCRPAEDIQLDPEKIFCNDVVFPHEFNPHTKRLFIIGNEFGPLCAVWASDDREALDNAVDLDQMDSFLVSEEDARADDPEEDADGICRLGNASEPFDLTYGWIRHAPVDPIKTPWLALAFAEARGAGARTLDEYPPHAPNP